MKQITRTISLTGLLLLILEGAAAGASTPVQVTFQNGLDGYEGTFDRRIGPGAAEVDGRVISGQSTYYIDGGANVLNDSGYSQGLIRFGGIESVLPAGAKVLNATLTVVQKTHSNAQSGDAFSVYRLTRPFDGNSSVATDFGADGIQGDWDWILGSFHPPNIDATASVVSADVTRAVQSWVDGSPNHGLAIASDRGTNGWSFHTTGAAQALRPKLVVTYLMGEGVRVDDFQKGSGNDQDCSDIFLNGAGATSEVAGSTIAGWTVQESWLDGLNPPTTEPDISGMLRFGGVESALAGRKIESAVLRVVTGFSSAAADSPGPFTLHRLLVPFTESSSYMDFAGASGAMLAAGQITPAVATFTGMQDCEVVDVDVSEVVRSWAAGAPNHGFYIGSGSPNGWQIFTTGAANPSFRPYLRVVSSPAIPVTLTGPVNGSRHVLGSQVGFAAEAIAPGTNTITKVEMLLDGAVVAELASAPFIWSYQAAGYGTHTLRAVMTDSSGAVFTSEPVEFTVVPAGGEEGLYFDGVSDHVALGDPAALKVTTFTIETWFRRETAGVATTTGAGGLVAIPLVAKGRNQADNSTLDTNWFLGIRESDGVLCADFEGGVGTNVPVSGRTVVPYGVWQHAAATFDGAEWRLYLNGNLEAVRSAGGVVPRADSIQHASIATAMNSNGLGEGAFGGFIDEVRIWNRARSHAEVRSSMNREVPSADGLVARWGLGEGGGTIVTSSAAEPLRGTLGGQPVWTAGAVFSGNVMPSLALHLPLDGYSGLAGVPVALAVTVADPDGSVAKVDYYDNGVLIGTSMAAPFGFIYQNPPAGSRRIEAWVTDDAGAVSRSDVVTTLYLTFPAPGVGTYAAGIFHGGDADLSGGVPAADPAVWQVVAGTSGSRAFGDPGPIPGVAALNVGGAPVAYASGVVLTTPAAQFGGSAAIDNIVAPYALDDRYQISSMDNAGPGEVDPLVAPESSAFALAWFPYADGWVGANIEASGAIDARSNGLPAGVEVRNSGAGIYQISGLPASGNLLAVATGEGADNYAAVGLQNEVWTVTVRDNSQNLENGAFAILYVPATADRVLSGHIGNLGEVTALNGELAGYGLHCRVTPQGYEITVGDGSVVNPGNAVLMVTPDIDSGNGGDNAYSYAANGNAFVVFSHDLPGLNGILQNGGFRFLAVPLAPAAVDRSEVVVAAPTASVVEGSGLPLVFRFTRLGSVDQPLVVAYEVSGAATAGADYPVLPGQVVIPAGASSATVEVLPLADSALELSEAVALTVVSGSGYKAGLQKSASGFIHDGGTPVATRTVSFQQGVGGYTGTFQRRVGLTLPATYSAVNGASVASYALDGGNPDLNDLIRFDGVIGTGDGQVPPDAVILKAELVLTTAVASDAQSAGPFIVDRLTSAVDEATTYDAISAGAGFEGVRGIASGLPVAGFPPLAQGEAGAADVTSIVRAWLGGEANHGFAIYSGGTTDGWNYCTIGNPSAALRPQLRITYVTGTQRSYQFTADRSTRINSMPGTVTLDGSGIEAEFLDAATGSTQEALMHFPVAFGADPGAIPLDEEIVKAELLLTTPGAYLAPGAYSPGPVTVHRMLADWTVASTYGAYGPRPGIEVTESVGSLTGLGYGSTTWLDVTAVVRAWRAGAQNHGINLKPGTGDEWMLFWPGSTFGESVVPRLRITTVTAAGSGETPYVEWAAGQGKPGMALDADDDRDGIDALTEYALGLDPKRRDSLPQAAVSAGKVGISFAKGAQAAADPRVRYRILGSVDLREWMVEPAAVDGPATIALEQAAAGRMKFFRLEITYTP